MSASPSGYFLGEPGQASSKAPVSVQHPQRKTTQLQTEDACPSGHQSATFNASFSSKLTYLSLSLPSLLYFFTYTQFQIKEMK